MSYFILLTKNKHQMFQGGPLGGLGLWNLWEWLDKTRVLGQNVMKSNHENK